MPARPVHDRRQGEIAMGEDDRRASPRVKTSLRGCISYDKHAAAADCLVRDMSDTGAKLELSENVVIPYLIDLYIPKKDETLRANVLWRYGDLIGVAFTSPPSKRGDLGADDVTAVAEQGLQGVDLAERVRRIEAEVASLKRTIKNLLDAKTPLLRLPV
jgi:PilZ domain-containing protein